jgi:hypothetical protein
LLYGVTSGGHGSIAHGPGIVVELGWSRGQLDLAVRVLGQYRFLREVRSDRIRLSTQDVVVAGSLSGQLQLTGPIGWRAELGGGAELVGYEPRMVSSEVMPRDAGSDTRPFLLVGMGPALRSHELWVRMNARLDIELGRTRYEIMTQGEAETELSVPRVQPGIFVELGGAPIHF